MKNRPVFSTGRAVFNSNGKRLSKVFKYRSQEYLRWTVIVRKSSRSGMAQLEIRSVGSLGGDIDLEI